MVLVLLRLSDLAAGERRARQAVHDRERYFRSLVQNSSEAMMVFDRDGVVTDASPAVQALLGVSAPELVGNRAGDAIPGLDRETTGSVWSTLLATTDVVITAEVADHHARSAPAGWRCGPPTCSPTRPWPAWWSTSTTSPPAARCRATSSAGPSPTRSPAWPTVPSSTTGSTSSSAGVIPPTSPSSTATSTASRT